MAKYYVNNSAQPNGDHEVHRDGCSWLALIKSRKEIGEHYSCLSAVIEAKKTYTKSNGCIHCSKDCHTS